MAAAIDAAGGLTKASILTGYSATALQRWRAQGKITKAGAAFALAEKTGVPVKRLLGLEG